MKKFFFLCLAAGASVVASAQRGYFLYLQTEDQTPFYLRIADKIYSSSTAGYLILPNLADSTYTFSVGFARSTQPEIRFAVTINQNDKGYLLKKFTEGFSLFDLQSLALVKPVAVANDNTVYETKTDKFTSVLSKAADDPTLLKVPVVKKEEREAKEPVARVAEEPKKVEATKEPETAKLDDVKPTLERHADTTTAKQPGVASKEQSILTRDSLKISNSSDVKADEVLLKEETKTAATKVEEPPKEIMVETYKPSTVIRRSESSTTEGVGIVYFDKMEAATDTIRILIPPVKNKIDGDAPTASLSEIEKRRDTSGSLSLPPNETKAAPVEQVPTEVKIKSEPVSKPQSGQNGTCKESANEKDFMKLRKNMAAKEDDDAMIAEAKKSFKSKCFTVEQIRYLSTLFLTSAAKYQFFDASYSHVSDRQDFGTLQGEIRDEYYLKRFKALVGE